MDGGALCGAPADLAFAHTRVPTLGLEGLKSRGTSVRAARRGRALVESRYILAAHTVMKGRKCSLYRLLWFSPPKQWLFGRVSIIRWMDTYGGLCHHQSLWCPAIEVQSSTRGIDDAPGDVAPPNDKRAHAAVVLAQAAVRGHLVRLGFAEACALYFGSPGPPNTQGASSPADVCFRRIHGGSRAFDFACCARAALAVPLTLSEAPAIFPHMITNSPGRAGSAVLGNRQSSGCIDVTEQQRKRIKGAAGRKGAAAAAATQLRLAREAAIEAKCRVSMFRGELYFNHSRALKHAEDADDVRATPKAGAEVHVRWLHPVFRKEAVQAAFEPFGSIKHVQMRPGDGMANVPKTTTPFVDCYNYAIVIYDLPRQVKRGGGARRDERHLGDVRQAGAR